MDDVESKRQRVVHCHHHRGGKNLKYLVKKKQVT